MTPKELVIIGTGGFARETLWIATNLLTDWRPVGFLDDAESKKGTSVCDLPVLGKILDWPRFQRAWMVISIGAPRIRNQVEKRMRDLGRPQFATLVDPSVRKSRFVEIGEGSIIASGCIMTTQIRVGRHCILNLGVTVGHDVVIGDFTTVAPLVPISGNVLIEDGVEIGTGAAVKQGVTLGRGSLIGMGAVVTRSVVPHAQVVGNPARQVKTLPAY